VKLSAKILGLFLLYSTFAIGQEASNVFKPHVFLGLVTSQVGGDQFSGFNKLGLSAGIGIKTKFSENLGLGFDLSYIQKGSRKGANPKANDFSFYRMSLQYVEVPVYLVYYQDRFNFDVGLSAAYLLGASEERDGIVFNPGDFSPFNTLDFSLLFGFDYSINEKWKFQTRFSNSIVPFRDFEGQSTLPIQVGQYHSLLLFKIIREIGQ